MNIQRNKFCFVLFYAKFDEEWVIVAPAGVAQWIEYWPENQGVIGSIPSQGTCLGCGPGLQ